ncbi:MAG TPA: SUMF1/EgtB/PvdO family nonheme iron enzyme, partial [Blastocatellia bacterium]
RVVLKALSKKKDDRQLTAQRLSRELEEALTASHVPLKVLSGNGGRTLEYAAGRVSTPDDAAQETVALNIGQLKTGSANVGPGEATRPLGGGVGSRRDTSVDALPPELVSAIRTKGQNRGTLGENAVDVVDKVQTAAPPRSKRWIYASVVAVLVIASVFAAIRLRAPSHIEEHPPDVGPGTIPGMVLISGGKFTMGTSDTGPEVREEWRPSHPETVGDFYLDSKEVTNDEYARFVAITNYPPPPNWQNRTYAPGESQLPVRDVSWYDAQKYAEWAGKRLPTEAEWEYAARGSDGRNYPWGNEWSPQLSNSGEEKRGKPVAVGSYPRGVSPFGIYDMAGNVSEWVDGDFSLYPGSKGKPQPGLKIYKGGAFNMPKDQLVTYARWTDDPHAKLDWVGFRCAKSLAN